MILTEDIAKTILAGCYKFGAATMLRCEGATMTKVIEVYEEDTRQTDRGDNLQGEILPILGGGGLQPMILESYEYKTCEHIEKQ